MRSSARSLRSSRLNSLPESESYEERKLTIWEHLEELGRRAKVAILAWIVATIAVGLVPLNPVEALWNPAELQTPSAVIFHVMKSWFLPEGVKLIAGTFGNPIMSYIYVAIILGLAVSAPVIAYEAYAFINPGLYPSERKVMLNFALPFAALFSLGLAYGLFLIVPITFRALTWTMVWVGAEPFVTIDDFISMTLGMLAVCGFLSTIPLFFVYAVRARLVKTDVLTRRRKYIYGGFIILACIITPDPTPVSALLIALPFIALTEIAVRVAQRYEAIE